LRRVVDPMIVNFEAQTPEEILRAKKVPDNVLSRCREVGATLGTGAAMGLF